MKQFLKHHDILLRLVSLMLAVVMWAIVMDEENPTKYKWYDEVPVQIMGVSTLGEQTGMSVIEGADSMIEVQLKGPNKSVTSVSTGQITATVDVSELTEPGEYDLPVTVAVTKTGIEIASRQPGKVHLRVDRMETRTVPVEITLEGTVSEGFRASRPVSKTDKITIEGPSSELSGVKKACATVNVEGQSTTLSEVECTVTLCNEAGEPITSPFVVSKTDTIRVSVPISKINTLPLAVTLKDGGTVRASQAKWTVEPKDIQVIADDPNTIAQMEELNLGEIDLGSVRTDVPIEMLIKLPDGVRLDAGQPAKALVTITIEGVDTRKVQVTKFVPTDTAEGQTAYDITVETESVEIELRGSQSALDQVDMDSFSIGLTLDSVSLGEGKHTVKGVVTAIGLPTGVAMVEEDVQVDVQITAKPGAAEEDISNGGEGDGT